MTKEEQKNFSAIKKEILSKLSETIKTESDIQTVCSYINEASGSNFKIRNCLKCKKTFLSEGFGNRVCGPCSSSNNYIYTPIVHDVEI